MNKTFDQGREEIVRLCASFDPVAFHAVEVKEADVRQSLIDPFFEALGWDVHNTEQAALRLREVMPEESLEVEGQQKTPDYTFRMGQSVDFYVEAKKCAVDIGADAASAFQIRRYGWNARLGVSILTNFEQFAEYDCTQRPRPNDKPSHARIRYLEYKEFPDHWRELWDVFSREALHSGAFDRYAASKRAKRGTSQVDSEFLKEIEGWRGELARHIALRNPQLSHDDLNRAVQLIVDRVVFLRMAEDRRLEPYGQLLNLCHADDVYPRFIETLCRDADEKYNSGLFHFRKERETDDEPDRITPSLAVDDKVFKPIVQGLYFEHGSPYDFRILPVEILGTVYERFLGKVIHLTEGHRARVEEKPEVRKAGGVYYTPAYIVDYIVEHTVGRQVRGRSPSQLAGLRNGKQPFRVLDMACGSGSFLLGAYQRLLGHCFDWYVENNPAKHKKAVYKDARAGQWRLTIEEKKRILTAHVFGVDIDPQAVEVSKLSLLLKVLEGEDDQTVRQQQQKRIFPDRALPNLAGNIKCGNSLVASDYFIGGLIPDADEIHRVNPFDWEQAFPQAVKGDGFDCVIGNPPYGATFSEGVRQYVGSRFLLAEYQIDSYALFLERAVNLLRENGRLGYIIPNTWLLNLLYVKTRNFVFRNTAVEHIIHYRRPVFSQATVDTEIVVLKKGKPDPRHRAEVQIVDADGTSASHKTRQSIWRTRQGGTVNILETPAIALIGKKMRANDPLERLAVATQGTKPFQVGKGTPPQTRKTVDEKPYVSDRKRNSSFRPLLRGSLMNRYTVLWRQNYWISFGDWLAEPRYSANSDAKEKIIIRQTGDSLVATLDRKQFVVRDNLYTIIPRHDDCNLRYLLGLINSRPLNWFYQNVVNPERGEALAQVKRGHIAQLPIPEASTSQRNRMVSLVDAMLAFHERAIAAKSVAQREVIQRQIDATDAKIDRLVCELYGLTKEEIAIVEGAE